MLIVGTKSCCYILWRPKERHWKIYSLLGSGQPVCYRCDCREPITASLVVIQYPRVLPCLITVLRDMRRSGEVAMVRKIAISTLGLFLAACAAGTPAADDVPDHEQRSTAESTSDLIEELEVRVDVHSTDDPGRADLLHVLADLHRQRHEELLEAAMEVWEDEVCQQARSGSTVYDECDARERAFAEEGEYHLAQSAHRYEEIIADYPDYYMMAEVLLDAALVLQWSGRRDEAIGHLGELIDTHSESDQAIHGHLAMGDHFFALNQLERAENHYEKVTKADDVALEYYGRYKMGWVHLNRGEYERSLSQFSEVIQGTRHLPDGHDAVAFGEHAVDDFVRVAARLDDVEVAIQRLSQTLEDRKELQRSLELLSRFYVDAVNYDEAKSVLERLVSMEPDGDDGLRYQAMLGRVYLLEGDRRKATSLLEPRCEGGYAEACRVLEQGGDQ